MSTLPASARYDALIIGAGHNGLVCAAYLARAGRRVLVLEAGAAVGGAAITQEFTPGFRVSAGAHLLHLMPARIEQELGLSQHGLEMAATHLPTMALHASAPPGTEAPLAWAGGAAAHLRPPAGLTPTETAAYSSYTAQLSEFAAALQPIFEGTPPRLGTKAWSDKLSWLRLGWQVRRLGRRHMRELLRIGAMNVFDLLQEHFADPRLQGALAFDAVLGSNYGPRSPGTVLTLLCRAAAQRVAGSGGLRQPRGGLGALSAALARAAAAAGAEIRLETEVAQILVNDDRASGVRLRSGAAIQAAAVISNADPKRTFLELLGTAHLDTGFVRRVHHLRTQGMTGKLHLALSGVPRFGGLSDAQLQGRVILAPSMDYLERAFNSTKYGEYAAAPTMEITLPTLSDSTLAPPGAHVLSAVVQYLPYALKEGWEAGRQRCLETLIKALEARSPGLAALVQGAQLLTPVDIEQRMRITGGHWHHAELAFDQFYMVRPVPGAAQYSTPLPGLYLCGAGSHPGGGVMGYAGRNAARQVLAQRGKP